MEIAGNSTPVREDSSPSLATAPATKAKNKTQASKAKSKSSSSSLKEAEKRIKALEMQLETAQRQALPLSSPKHQLGYDPKPQADPVQARGSATDRDWSPDRAGSHRPPPQMSTEDSLFPATSPRLQQSGPLPTATFTPMAAGLRPQSGDVWHSLPPQLQDLITNAFSQGIAVGANQQVAPQPQPSGHQSKDVWAVPVQPSGSLDPLSEDYSLQDEDSNPEDDLSEDEGTSPEPQVFTGLFKPSLFHILLHKAKLVAGLDEPEKAAETTEAPHPSPGLFVEPRRETEHIPSSRIFLDCIKRACEQPIAPQGPSNIDRKFYTFGQDMEDLLQFPTVDPPVAGLVSTALVPSDLAEGLKPEDKKAESILRKSHQMSAWAVRASSAASFFARASIVWIKDIQTRVDPHDARLRQDLNKLLAATEFMADATLNATKFASRAMTTSVASRRLLWLRNWQADSKSKWRLAASAFEGSKLFGEALDKVLIEDRDKKKVLPRSSRRNDRRPAPYFRRQPFRQETSQAAPPAPRSYSQGAYGSASFRTDRHPFNDRFRQSAQTRRPFRGHYRGGYRKNR